MTLSAASSSTPRCALADDTVDAATVYRADASACPFHRIHHQRPAAPSAESLQALKGIRLHIVDGDYDRTPESAALLQSIGGGARLRELTTRFYAYAMRDSHLKEFFWAEDGIEPAAERLGTWLIQFMGGEGNPWDDLGRAGRRQESHARAWMSAKRPRERRGRRFKLDDCRVWMRLMFLAAREIGLLDNEAFAQWFVQFIAFFMRIYEETAPPFAKVDLQWSADAATVRAYLENGRLMRDVIGIHHAYSPRSMPSERLGER